MEIVPVSSIARENPRKENISSMPKLRLLYITSRFPYGGSEAFFAPELRELKRMGHDVIVVPKLMSAGAAHPDASEWAKSDLCKPLLSPRILFYALLTLFRFPRRVFNAILGANRPYPGLNNLLQNLAIVPKALWLVHIVRDQQVNHIHASWVVAEATMAFMIAEISQIPWSMTGHRGDIIQNNNLAARISAASFTRFIAIASADLAENISGLKRPATVHVIHLGVTVPEASAIVNCGRWEGGTLRLVCVASLSERKGHTYLIDAIEALIRDGQSIHVDFVGDGPLRDKISQRIIAGNLSDYITLVGHIPHSDLLMKYELGEYDAVVLSSSHEGIPVSLMEGMAYRLPVIGSEVGGIPELLREGAGIMVPFGDSSALAKAIRSLLDSPSLYATLSNAGRRRILEEYDVRYTAAELVHRMAVRMQNRAM